MPMLTLLVDQLAAAQHIAQRDINRPSIVWRGIKHQQPLPSVWISSGCTMVTTLHLLAFDETGDQRSFNKSATCLPSRSYMGGIRLQG